MKIAYLFFIFILCWSCTSETEKKQKNRNNIIHVKDKMKEIVIEDVLIGQYSRMYLAGKHLIISDLSSVDAQIHLFDKNNFNYLSSTAPRGQGPDEITRMGHIESDETTRIIYVSDHGKNKIFSYDLDSILVNPQYKPKEKMKMKSDLFPDNYLYVNDTLCIGLVIAPVGNADYKPTVAKWNMRTGEIQPMKYEHPDIGKKRITFAASMKHGIYVECYSYHDLMTICDLDGNLKYNIYGQNWDNRISNQTNHYGKVRFVEDKIFTVYSGKKNTFNAEDSPTKFFVFDMNGDYLKTIETNYKIVDFCYDQDNSRIIIALDDEMQFAYLDLDGLI